MSPRGVLRTTLGGALVSQVQRRSGTAAGFVRPQGGGQAGQATVELVALLPVLLVVLAGAWQAVLAGHAAWAATTAARAAARANAVGFDATRAARTRLPGSLEGGLRVRTGSDGDVEVRVRIPSLPGLPSPGHASAGARFEPQS
jgi:TadE-like protein